MILASLGLIVFSLLWGASSFWWLRSKTYMSWAFVSMVVTFLAILYLNGVITSEVKRKEQKEIQRQLDEAREYGFRLGLSKTKR